MTKTRLIGVLLVALAAFGSSDAYAAPQQMQLEVGTFLGAHFFSDRNELGRYRGDTTSNALKHSAMFGLRVAYIVHPRVGLEGELAIIPTGTRTGEAQAMALGYRAHLLVHILTGRIKPFVLVGGGGFSSTSSDPTRLAQDTDGELHAGVGVKALIGKSWGLRLDGRVQFSPATEGFYFTQDYEVNLGIYGVWDLCKGKKHEGITVTERKPEPVKAVDSDGDGVADSQDACPNQAGLVENKGCPDRDSDGDGIVDRLDRCPGVRGEDNGCPDQDSDGDSVVDRLDKCPADKGVVEMQGCPDPDGDKDGVPDRLDKCLDKPETMNGFDDEDGCPDEIPQAVKQFTGAIEGIGFQTGKAIITKKSYPTLDSAVKVLVEYPTVRMEIQGHTDNVGARDKNVTLSQERADAVKAYFLGKGIKTERIRAMGYGPDKPVEDNKTSKGRAKNRRVEFQLITGSK